MAATPASPPHGTPPDLSAEILLRDAAWRGQAMKPD
jgi:hypothetical protein